MTTNTLARAIYTAYPIAVFSATLATWVSANQKNTSQIDHLIPNHNHSQVHQTSKMNGSQTDPHDQLQEFRNQNTCSKLDKGQRHSKSEEKEERWLISPLESAPYYLN